MKSTIILYMYIFSFMSFAGSEIEVKDELINESFKRVYFKVIKGGDFKIWGESFIRDEKTLKLASKMVINFKGKVVKAYLVWSGSIIGNLTAKSEILFLTPNGEKTLKAAPDNCQLDGSRSVYSSFYDVTEFVQKSGDYGVKGIKTDRLASGKYSIAGWALIVIFQYDKMEETREIKVNIGVAKLRPGLIHGMNLGEAVSGDVKIKLGMVGGHATKGNGSSNLINGISLTGKEDWDGSSGYRWDVDIFEKKIDSAGKVYLQIDPLLQWIYPVAFILSVTKE